jgi:DNA invertase Pin-like site-specific DNA recombinase
MRAIAYYRVSTAKQGKSGLGLDSQQQSVREFCTQHSIELMSEHTEIETGKGHDALNSRPVLVTVLAQAKRLKATIIVAKLDRLGRDVHFITGLMAQKIPFVVTSIGMNATDFELHIRATLAQEEARLISERTKSALAQAKQRGTVLGNPINLTESGLKGNKTAIELADNFALNLANLIHPMVSDGTSYRQIAIRLNAMKIPTQRGKEWTPVQASNIIKRLNQITGCC